MSTNGQTKVPANQYTEKIGVGEKIAYGGGDLASNLILVLTSTFVTFFYTDALGLNAAIIGTIMMLSRVFDGFTDIFMGFVMDQVKSKHGKARCVLAAVAGDPYRPGHGAGIPGAQHWGDRQVRLCRDYL